MAFHILKDAKNKFDERDIQKAREMVEKITYPYKKASTLLYMGEKYLKQNESEKAREIYLKIADLLIDESYNSSTVEWPDLECAHAPIVSYAYYGGKDKEVFIKFIEAAGKIQMDGCSALEIQTIARVSRAYDYSGGKERDVYKKILEAINMIYPKCCGRKIDNLRQIGILYRQAGFKLDEEERELMHQIVVDIEKGIEYYEQKNKESEKASQ